MTAMVLTAAYISINSNDLKAYAKKATVKVQVDKKDVTTFASGGWKELVGGLKSGSLGIEFFQDVSAAALDSIMWPLLGTVVPFEVRLTQAAVGASNPKYTGNILISDWEPLNGSVGDTASVSCSFETSGVVTRATS